MCGDEVGGGGGGGLNDSHYLCANADFLPLILLTCVHSNSACSVDGSLTVDAFLAASAMVARIAPANTYQ